MVPFGKLRARHTAAFSGDKASDPKLLQNYRDLVLKPA
jgi:hypothetical protein